MAHPYRRKLTMSDSGESLLMRLSDRLFYRPDRRDRGSPADHSLRYEDVFFPAADGSRLHGWFLPAEADGAARGTVLHLHGNAANITGHYEFVRWLPAAGYDVLTFDYRGYGRSEGRASRRGMVEDGAAALDYLRGREDVDASRVMVYGQSIGAAVAVVMAAERRDQIQGLVAEGGFSDYRKIARHHVMRNPLLTVLAWWVPLVIPRGADPIDSVGAISPVPVLFVHGTADGVVPWRMSQAMYDRAGAPKELWLIDEMGHYEVWEAQPEAAQTRLLAFFELALDCGSDLVGKEKGVRKKC